jgi:hypothetical protein
MKSKIPFAELFAGAQPPAVAPDGPQIPLFEMIRLFRSEPAAAPVAPAAPAPSPHRTRRKRMQDQLQLARHLMRDLKREELILLHSEIADTLAGHRPAPN